MSELKPLHNALFQIYQEMDKVCERHNLRLFGTSGTALGAVRHKGFIPWDDDIDVGMPRPDYEKFLEIADAELPPYLRTLTWRNCDSYSTILSKVIIVDPDRVDELSRQTGLEFPMGVYVDIFPFDGFPVTFCGVRMRLLRMIFYKTVEKISEAVGCRKLFKGAIAMRERELRRIPYESARRVINNMWFSEELRFSKSPKSEWYGPSALGRGKLVPFEDGTMRVFDDVDVYLRSIYGNYMKLPPADRRRPSHGDDDVAKVPWRLGPGAK